MSHTTQHTCTQSTDNNRKLENSQSTLRHRVFDMWNMSVAYGSVDMVKSYDKKLHK